MPQLKEEKPGLKMSQYKDLLWKVGAHGFPELVWKWKDLIWKVGAHEFLERLESGLAQK